MKTEAPFTLDFVLEGKSLLSDADEGFYVEGYASDFGVDRQNEAFETGAFDAGMKAFMETNPILIYHHKYDQPLGQVKEYKMDQKGMWVKAWVSPAEAGTPLADVTNKIRSGIIRGFSIGGKFHRHMTPRGMRIHTADIAELSMTPLPINPRTLATVAGKAFGDEEDADLKSVTERLEKLEAQLAQAAEDLTE